MPYIQRPKWARWVQEGLYIARYGLTGAAGVLAVTLSSVAAVEVTGAVLALVSLVALVGVITRRFQIELVPLWFVLGAVAVLAVYLLNIGNLASGVLALALVPDLGARLLSLSLIARRARRLPEVR